MHFLKGSFSLYSIVDVGMFILHEQKPARYSADVSRIAAKKAKKWYLGFASWIKGKGEVSV